MEVSESSAHKIGNFIFVPGTRQLFLGEELHKRLTTKESQLLDMLFDASPNILMRENALREIWHENSYFTSRSMDVYITRLRKYLKQDSNVEILNYHGKGHKLLIYIKTEQ